MVVRPGAGGGAENGAINLRIGGWRGLKPIRYVQPMLRELQPSRANSRAPEYLSGFFYAVAGLSSTFLHGHG